MERPTRRSLFLARRLQTEHRRLDRLFGQVRDAFDPEIPGVARLPRFGRLREALEAHFGQEDTLYYPAIWSLRPEHKDALQGFMRGHEIFRAQLVRIGRYLASGSLGAARRTFERLVEGFERHERAEEALLAALEAEIQITAGQRADSP